jgi:micrococcal nuclease
MQRRRFLTAIAATGAATLAGCSEESGSSSETSGTSRTASPTASASATSPTSTQGPSSSSATPTSESTQTTTEGETSTATETEAETDTETATETQTETTTEDQSESSSLPGTSETIEATITRIVDGDTIEVTLADGTDDTIRLLGVDTPETYSENEPEEYGLPSTVAAKDHLANWGDQATSFATNRLDGTEVTIGIDPESDRRGSYGRLLCYLYYDGETNLNRELLEEGLARVYPSEFMLRSKFERVEQQAQSADRGLWGYDGGSGSGSTSTPTETESEDSYSGGSGGGGGGGGSDLPPPSGGASDPYDCSDFDSQEQAQQALENTPGDPSGLDSDEDGEACESLD